MDTLIRGLGVFVGVFVGSVIAEYIVMRLDGETISSQSVSPADVPIVNAVHPDASPE